MKSFIPVEKQSKKAQHMLSKKQRGTWGAINPVTRKSPDPKAYKREKISSEDIGEQSGPDQPSEK